eukprot:831736-Prorocentrum_minimum.AAC.1
MRAQWSPGTTGVPQGPNSFSSGRLKALRTAVVSPAFFCTPGSAPQTPRPPDPPVQSGGCGLKSYKPKKND